MPKRKLKKILPSHEKIKKQKFLKIFGKTLQKREIWSLSRKRVLAGVLIGVFVAALPMPLQMVLATLLAIVFNANLPISFTLIFISNPFTMPPIFYAEYQIGKLFLGIENNIEFSFDSMYDNFEQIALALWSGALIFGIFTSVVTTIIVNFLWISMVKKRRKKGSQK